MQPQKKKVLVVDDNKDLTRLVEAGLRQYGYEVQVENQSTQAVSRARAFAPDVIVLDMVMPDKDGGDIAQEIRASPRLQHVPIIFLTSILSKEEAAKKEGKLAEEIILAKPTSVDELARQIEKCLR